jgi:glutamyl-tRNA synthetase
VLLKSDGFPTYHLANVIDDHLMGITHIMRAQEWIPSGPLHIILYEAFGWEPPIYCHLPMVMGKDGQKLSKRHGSTSVRDFKAKGYLPEALINYVSMVGWSYDGVREFFTREELGQVFSLEKINKAPGVFDYKKLDWYNGMYIRQKSDQELADLLAPYLVEAGFIHLQRTPEESKLLESLVPVVKERLKVLSDVVEMVRFLFEEIAEPAVEQLLPKNQDIPVTVTALEKSLEIIMARGDASDAELELRLSALAEQLGIKINGVFMPVRVAVTGSTVSPPLFDSIRLLGLDKAISRIERAVTILKGEVR